MGRLSQLRKNAGLSQATLAAAVGVTVSAVKAWENGRRRPSAASIMRLYKALGLTGEDIARIVHEGVKLSTSNDSI